MFKHLSWKKCVIFIGWKRKAATYTNMKVRVKNNSILVTWITAHLLGIKVNAVQDYANELSGTRLGALERVYLIRPGNKRWIVLHNHTVPLDVTAVLLT